MPLYRSGSGSSVGGVIVGGTAGRVVYEATGPVLADSANFQYSTAENLGLSITPTVGFHQLGGNMRLQALATPSAPTVTVNSGSGTNYYYYIVAEDRNAYRTVPSAASSVASSSATPNNTITWTTVAGAVKYYVLRHTAGTLPAAPSTGNYLVGTWTSGSLSVTDTNAAGTSFTTNSRNATADFIVDGSISCPGAGGSDTEHFGGGSTAAGTRSCSVGPSASCAGTQSVSFGYGALGAGGYSVAVGYGAQAWSTSDTCVGNGASAAANVTYGTAIGQAAAISGTSASSIVLGVGATINGLNSSIAIGRSAAASASNQLVVGSTTYFISTVCVGYGVTVTSNGTPASMVLTTTSGAEGSTDVPGNNIIIAGGKSTGLGVGGYVKFQTSPAAIATGSGTNALVDRVLIDQNGNVVLAATGSALATDAVNGFSYIPTCAGIPTGVPAYLPTGAAPVVYNTTDNRLCIYNPTGTPAWKFVTLGA